ncbi:hypothetical protein COS79_01700 [Candidatus Woesearchaeota archaeon CG06_land_8_20_14_3_00_33_13]|nr:MAG: hypothetical protein COS79_01700 [Candidatus Woesearchaeota archaeon CG06_land_8_20_14_3_00_33_13]
MLHMEQKSYKLEIIRVLLKKNSHIREIAKKLNINHMMVVRKIKELSKENVVDFTQEGKNQTYFLKKTAETQAYVFIAEQYILIQAIIKYPGLRGIIEKIQRDKRIKLAVLFGSYAKGLAGKDSDIDIFIETKNTSLKKELALIDSKLSIKIGMYNKETNLIKEIDKDHVIIKGIEYYYEKNQFFG